MARMMSSTDTFIQYRESTAFNAALIDKGSKWLDDIDDCCGNQCVDKSFYCDNAIDDEGQ